MKLSCSNDAERLLALNVNAFAWLVISFTDFKNFFSQCAICFLVINPIFKPDCLRGFIVIGNAERKSQRCSCFYCRSEFQNY